jgi:hypothetical protein
MIEAGGMTGKIVLTMDDRTLTSPCEGCAT